MRVVLIPSVSGGIGHISRTATLARRLQTLDTSLSFEFLLDTDRLRPFNIEAAERTGFSVRLLPSRTRASRDAIVRNCLGHADLIIEDTQRYLIPYRAIVPQASWISIPLFPIGDELFLDWPQLAQADGIIWAYAPLMDSPPELLVPQVAPKVCVTGPFLELDGVPSRKEARRKLKLPQDEQIVVYAPRGMPFGRAFGEAVLSGAFGAVKKLRKNGAKMRLVLLAVTDARELRCTGVPATLPDWVHVVGLVTPQESLFYMRAADIVIAEGTSTAHEAAALQTPLVMVPGPIPETWLLGTRLHEHGAAQVLWIEAVTPSAMAKVFRRALDEGKARNVMLAKAHEAVTGGGGVEAAARFVLEVVRRK